MSEKMSDIDVAYFYESLENFKSSNFELPKTIQVIPYFQIKKNGDVFALLTLNNLQTLCDFGTSYSRNKTLESYLVSSLKYNSLDCINLTEEYILNNSHVAYATSYDVATGKNDLNYNPSPTVFVKINIETYEDVYKLLKSFKDSFRKKLQGILRSTSETTNIVYMDATEFYYMSRFTTYTIEDSNSNVIEVEIEEQGFPARDEITEFYTCDVENGDIPVSDKYNDFANTCPEVDFYYSRSINLGKSIVTYFNNNVPIL
jgi:hypothetical protein